MGEVSTPPADLRGDVLGGPAGAHGGSGDGPWGLAVWNGRAWVSAMNGTVTR